MIMKTLTDVIVDLDSLVGWAEVVRSTMAGMDPSTLIVEGSDVWRETPPTVRPPRLSICMNCVPETKSTVTAGDVTEAMSRMKAWLGCLRDTLGDIRGFDA